jgi:hypothetical protein
VTTSIRRSAGLTIATLIPVLILLAAGGATLRPHQHPAALPASGRNNNLGVCQGSGQVLWVDAFECHWGGLR